MHSLKTALAILIPLAVELTETQVIRLILSTKSQLGNQETRLMEETLEVRLVHYLSETSLGQIIDPL